MFHVEHQSISLARMKKMVTKQQRITILEKFVENARNIEKYVNLDKASHDAAKDVCNGISYWCIIEWSKTDAEVATLLSKARLARAEAYNELTQKTLNEILDFWTDEKGITRERMQAVNKAKLKIEHYRWHASKMCPDLYGDYYFEIKKVEENMKQLQKQIESLTEKTKSST